MLVRHPTQHRHPVWSRDGASIVVDGLGNQLWRLPVVAEGTFAQTGQGEMVFDSGPNFEFDVGPDGSLYVLTSTLDEQVSAASIGTSQSSTINVTINWFERVKELAPPAK